MRHRLQFKHVWDSLRVDVAWDGLLVGEDIQVPKACSWYGDPFMDTLLDMSCTRIGNLIDKELFPTYSFCRVHNKGATLDQHVDRGECQYSATLCVGGQPWPFFIEDKKGVTREILLEPGDILIYAGCELKHWRDTFQGTECTQLFFHYGDKNNPIGQLYDGRAVLGVPPFVRTDLLEKKLSGIEFIADTIKKVLRREDNI